MENYPVENPDKFSQMNTVHAMTLLAMAHTNYRLQEQVSQLEHAATHDVLTGVLNLRGLEAELESNRENIMGAIFLFADGNHIKRVNDKLGHEAGDQAIQHIADALTGATREDDIVARIGGDEFVAVLMPSKERRARSLDAASDDVTPLDRVTERIVDAVERIKAANPELRKLDWDIAVGSAIFQTDDTFDTVKDRSDQAMYSQKATMKQKRFMRLAKRVLPSFLHG